MADVNTRSYRSNIRRGDAPRLVCAAAHQLFSTQGYLATSIDDIASAAGVARPTVFSAVGPKPVILKMVVDQAMVGDDAMVPVAGRPWFKEAFEATDPVRSIQLHARNVTWITHRAGPLLKAVETAAAVDPDAARLWEQHQEQRRTGMRGFVASLATKTTLRCDQATATDMLWALIPDAYVRLVQQSGWSDEKFQAWLADVLEHVLLQ
jgi:AcrR family transcriptional regulator